MLAKRHGIKVSLIRVPSDGGCLYFSFQASMHRTWNAEGGAKLREEINLSGREMDRNIWIEEVGRKL